MNLESRGFTIVRPNLSEAALATIRAEVFTRVSAGERCLLDHPIVRETAVILAKQLANTGHLPSSAVAIQAIAFDKTDATNWKVPWHQDLMFPFARRVSFPGFDLPCIKQGIHYARPPEAILKRLLAARLHLDDCGISNGPLRVSPGTHCDGILDTAGISSTVTRHGEIPVVANEGEILLMRPLLLHASSLAAEPKNRRVLHFVYDSGEAILEPWHRSIRSLSEN